VSLVPTGMGVCGRDLTGLPEWVRGEYYQAHKDHGCLFSERPRLTAVVMCRVNGEELARIQAKAKELDTTVSGFIRDTIREALDNCSTPGEGTPMTHT